MSDKLYDANSHQHFPATLNVDGDEIEITHVIKPWDESCDVAMRDYLIAKAEAEGEDDEFDLALSAAKILYKKICSAVLGIGEEGETIPADFHDWIDELAIKKLIEDRITGIAVVPDSELKKKTVKWDAIKNRGNARRKARAYYDGEIVTMEATLRPINADIHRKINAASKLSNGARLDAAADVFDSLKVAVTGYAGRVPYHHRVSWGFLHINQSNRLLEKNDRR